MNGFSDVEVKVWPRSIKCSSMCERTQQAVTPETKEWRCCYRDGVAPRDALRPLDSKTITRLLPFLSLRGFLFARGFSQALLWSSPWSLSGMRAPPLVSRPQWGPALAACQGRGLFPRPSLAESDACSCSWAEPWPGVRGSVPWLG